MERERGVGAVLHAPRIAQLVLRCQRGSRARLVHSDQGWSWWWEAREFGTREPRTIRFMLRNLPRNEAGVR